MTSERVDILLVEDDDHDAELTMHALTAQGPITRVYRVRDGAEALDYMFSTGAYADGRSARPAVILLDLKLPRVDGFDVLERLKTHSQTASVPIVVWSSSREDRDLRRCYERGANSFVVKPMDWVSFERTLRQVRLYWTGVNQPVRASDASGTSADGIARRQS